MIREAKESDVAMIMEMVKPFHHAHGSGLRYGDIALFENCEDDWRDWVAGTIRSESGVVLVAERDGEAVGFVLGLVIPAPWCRNLVTAYESVLWVRPEHRGSGAASELMDGFERAAADAGAIVVTSGTSVWLGQKAMSRLLTGRGYRMDEKHYVMKLR